MLATALLGFTGGAQASPVLYTLSGVDLAPSGISGTYVYDIFTHTVVSAALQYGGVTYRQNILPGASSFEFVPSSMADLTGQPEFSLTFDPSSSLGDLHRPIAFAQSGVCSNANCSPSSTVNSFAGGAGSFAQGSTSPPPGSQHWTLTGASVGGVSLTGSFDYDYVNNLLLDVALQADGAVYGFGTSNAGHLFSFYPAQSADYTGQPLLSLSFPDFLFNTTPSMMIDAGYAAACTNAACSLFDVTRSGASGAAVASAIDTPEPASLLLFGVGMAATWAARRRRVRPTAAR